MKKLAVTLVALVFAAPVLAASQDVAPAVKRKPAAAAPAPAPASTAPAATSTAPAAPQQAVRTGSERDYIAALTAAAGQDGGNAALDTSLIRVMGRLMSAGRCGEAASLAARDGRKELASRAQQLCR